VLVFEGLDGSFCSIDAMVVWFYQLDVYFFAVDVLLYCLGALNIHDIELWFVSTRFQFFNDFFECGDHGFICATGHWSDNDGINAVEICHKDVLVIFVGSDGEFSSEVCVHGTFVCISQCCKAKHIQC
jgi:hypothetical protein